jgi:hypothetical protein
MSVRTLGRVLLGSVCTLSLAACASRPAPDRTVQAPSTRAGCDEAGGEWMLFPMGQFHFCALTTSDAGRECSDGRDCEGECRATGLNPVPGARVKGRCAYWVVMPGGCPAAFVDNGRVVLEPCI